MTSSDKDPVENSLLQALIKPPGDTPDRDPDDWLMVDSTGFRIPFNDAAAAEGSPEAEDEEKRAGG